MTYCVAMCLQEGIVFAGDTRTNAGIDHVSTFRKMYKFGINGERSIILLTAGNLATSQAVINMLFRGIQQESEHNLHNVSSLFDAAMLVGEYVSSVAKTTQHRAHSQEGFGSSFCSAAKSAAKCPSCIRFTRKATASAPPATPLTCKSAKANTASRFLTAP